MGQRCEKLSHVMRAHLWALCCPLKVLAWLVLNETDVWFGYSIFGALGDSEGICVLPQAALWVWSRYVSLRLKAKYVGLLCVPSSREKTGQPVCPLVQS